MGNMFFKEYTTLSEVRHTKYFQWVKMQTLKDKWAYPEQGIGTEINIFLHSQLLMVL